VKLSQLTKTKVFFINGLCPWDHNFFNKKVSKKRGAASNATAKKKKSTTKSARTKTATKKTTAKKATKKKAAFPIADSADDE
jgi:hypothetical protein